MLSEKLIPNQLIEDENLSDSDIISLHKELIRIIEKDIDSEESANSRKGVSLWGILIAMAGSLMYIFGETRKIQDVSLLPFEEIKIVFLTTLFFFYLVYFLLNILSGKPYFVRAGRLSTFEDSLYPIRGSLLVRALILIGVIALIYSAPLPAFVKTSSLIITGLLTLFSLFYFIFSFNTKRDIGNTVPQNKIGDFTTYIFLIIHTFLTISFGFQLPNPVGESHAAAFVIGVLSAVIAFLFEIFVLIYPPSKAIAKLSDLRNDIIFRRLSNINTALAQYQIIKEGKTLSDNLKPILEVLEGRIEEQRNLIVSQVNLINKIAELLPVQGERKDIKDKKRIEVMPLYESLNDLTEKHKSLIENIKTPLTDFYKKLNESANISGDYATSNLIQNALNQELQSLDADIAEISAAGNTIQQFIENPQLELPKQNNNQKSIKRRRKTKTNEQIG